MGGKLIMKGSTGSVFEKDTLSQTPPKGSLDDCAPMCEQIPETCREHKADRPKKRHEKGSGSRNCFTNCLVGPLLNFPWGHKKLSSFPPTLHHPKSEMLPYTR